MGSVINVRPESIAWQDRETNLFLCVQAQRSSGSLTADQYIPVNCWPRICEEGQQDTCWSDIAWWKIQSRKPAAYKQGGHFCLRFIHLPFSPVPHDIVSHFRGPIQTGSNFANGCLTLKKPHPSGWRWQSETVNTFIGGFTAAQMAEDINCDLVDGRRGGCSMYSTLGSTSSHFYVRCVFQPFQMTHVLQALKHIQSINLMSLSKYIRGKKDNTYHPLPAQRNISIR